MSRLQCLVEYFFMETGVYPLDLSEMEQVFRSRAPRAPRQVPIPLDPATNQPFKYQVDAQGRKYTISVPDPSKYGNARLVLAPVDWGYLADLADLRRFKAIVEESKAMMKLVATQTEMYAKDHSGHYPDSFDQMMPKYIQKFPSDPLTGKNLVYKKLLDGYTIGMPNPDRYGLKVFTYDSTKGIQMEQAARTRPTGKAPDLTKPPAPSNKPQPEPAAVPQPEPSVPSPEPGDVKEQ